MQKRQRHSNFKELATIKKKDKTVADLEIAKGKEIQQKILKAVSSFKGKIIEMNECIYWLDLLKETEYLSIEQYESIYLDTTEIIKLFTSIIKSTKSNLNN